MEVIIEATLRNAEPLKLTIHGDHGSGKSTLLEKHGLYYNYENGLRYINAQQVDLIDKPLSATTDTSRYIYKNAKELQKKHSCLVIDSLDFLQNTIHAEVCKEKNVKSISEIPYGAGYQIAMNHWREFLNSMEQLRQVGFNIVLICHSQIIRVANPNLEEYDMFGLKLHKSISAYIAEWSDFLGFVTDDVFTVQQSQKKFGETKYKPSSSGKRLLKFGHNPSYASKARLRLPDEIDLNWEAFLSAVAEARAEGDNAKTVKTKTGAK